MTHSPVSDSARQRLDASIEGALAALRRARKNAEKLAAQTGTSLIEAVDGQPVEVAPPKE